MKPCWNCILTFAACLAFTPPAAAGIAEIVSINGKGEHRENTEAAWREAKLKQQLAVGDFVRTLDLSAMAILFADRTQMRLSQNSMFQLKGDDAKGTTILNLRQGRAWSQAKPAPAVARPAGGAPPARERQSRLLMETPSAIGAIHGTDWEMEVDAEGRARLTVLHGEVEFYNDQGAVTVRNGEQALAEKGKAPVKLLLQNPAERVQWVTSYTVDPGRYAELTDAALAAGGDANRGLREITNLIREQRLKDARDRLVNLERVPQTSTPVAVLLLADFAIYGGELKQAEDILQQGRQRYPQDPRFLAQLARVALYRDDIGAARRFLQSGLAQYPEALELKLAEGEIARFDGRALEADNAYRAATRIAPGDARGWHGLGVVASEKEDVKRARPLLSKALELNAESPRTRGELATLETFANNLEPARRNYDLALQSQPDDYVTLTGFGLLQLKSGATEQALETLLRANVIEPKYARAVIYTAVAYYQLGRHRTALETLERAAELDSHDPLPHQLAAMIYTDLVEPGRALEEARTALRLMPFLKSLNQVANDQKGAANLGNALAQFGLDDWALNFAQQSYSPFWAGSHLFLADRYSGTFNKQSELMQGYLTDPTLFGASNRFQTLLTKPGHYFSASAAATRSTDLRTTTPSIVVNGYSNSAFPVAYFVEGLRTDLHPGDLNFSGNATNFTAALGMAPREDISVFAFANSFEADIGVPAAAQITERVTGRETRLDWGLNYKFSPVSQSWLKVGNGEENAVQTTIDRRAGRTSDSRFEFRPRNQDYQYRHSMLAGNNEWSWGIEHARVDKDAVLVSNSRVDRSVGAPLVTGIRDTSADVDKSWSIYLSDRLRVGDRWLFDIGLHYQHYEKSSGTVTQATQGAFTFTDSRNQSFGNQGIYPRLGLAFTPAAGSVWRVAYQKWLRPNAANSLGPVATAGIALDDQVVLPGGELERVRFQFEQEFSAHTFASVFFDAKQSYNLGQPGSVLNQREEVADLDRLRNRSALILRGSGEILEQTPAFLQGRMHAAGASLNRRMSNTLSGYAGYVHTDSSNTHSFFRDFQLPYMPRHRVILGATWAGPQRLVLQAQTSFRSRRYADEFHGSELPAGWDATVKATWQSADKRWLVEGYATDLIKKETPHTLGINAIWRY